VPAGVHVALRLKTRPTAALGGVSVASGPQLDQRWIEDGLIKRRSNYSPVICFETTDPRRVLQLRQHIAAGPGCERYEHVLAYDRWEGLSRLRRDAEGPRWERYQKSPGPSGLAQRIGHDIGVEMTQFRSALREVDPLLKGHTTAFIIQNLAENREWESGLESALRAWSLDSGVIARGSTVFILTADAGRILDDFTRDLVVVIPVDPSSSAERESMVRSIGSELGVTVDEGRAGDLVMATAGLNLHQLESVLLESYQRLRRLDPGAVKGLKAELVKRSGMLEVRDPTYSFADIGGYQAIKDFIRKYVINVLRDSARARRFALPLPRGILFFGPPGTGKSLFAGALAAEVELPFINLVTENIYSKWLGESGQKMKSAIRLAEKMSPAIVFVDEIDRFGRRAAATDSAGEETRRVFSQFLEWLGDPGREAIIVGTTNMPELLDEAFTRAGRFDYKVPLLYPGDAARLDVLAVHLGLKPASRRAGPPLAMDAPAALEFLRAEVVPRTGDFSCAELEELVTRAKRLAFDRGADALGREDFAAAARSFRVDRESRAAARRRYLEHARRFTDDTAFLDEFQQEMGLSP